MPETAYRDGPLASIREEELKEDTMKRVKKTIRSLVMLVLVCAMLTTFVFAAENGSVWLNVMQASTEQVDAWIVADTTVTDGQVELTYDSTLLTYQSVEVNGDYVAMHAVNAEEPGVVKIAWVAPEAYETEEAVWLVKVTFAGEGSVTLSGAVNGGEAGDFAGLDKSELEKAILEAEGLYEDDYTSRSWGTLEKALSMAKETLNDPTATQSQVNAAAETLNNGIASLELKLFTNNAELYKAILRAEGLCEDKYTAESWAALEEALANAKAVKNDRKATQKQIDEATQALNNAIDALVLKSEEEVPTEPEEPDATEKPEETTAPTEPEKPSQGGGSWFDKFKDWFGGWFSPEKPEETTAPTEPEVTEAPETTAPAEEPEDNKGGWFDWIGKWFGGWGR